MKLFDLDAEQSCHSACVEPFNALQLLPGAPELVGHRSTTLPKRETAASECHAAWERATHALLRHRGNGSLAYELQKTTTTTTTTTTMTGTGRGSLAAAPPAPAASLDERRWSWSWWWVYAGVDLGKLRQMYADFEVEPRLRAGRCEITQWCPALYSVVPQWYVCVCRKIYLRDGGWAAAAAAALAPVAAVVVADYPFVASVFLVVAQTPAFDSSLSWSPLACR